MVTLQVVMPAWLQSPGGGRVSCRVKGLVFGSPTQGLVSFWGGGGRRRALAFRSFVC